MWFGKANALVQCMFRNLTVYPLAKKYWLNKIMLWCLQFQCLALVCSYIGGSESEGHFSVINDACSMLVS